MAGSVIARLTIALFAGVVGTDGSAFADDLSDDVRPAGVRPVQEGAFEKRSADALGTSRLFFTAEERRAVEYGASGGSSAPSSGTGGGARAGEGEPDVATERRAGDPTRAKASGAVEADRSRRVRESKPSSRGIVFEALLNSDARAQAVFGGRLCRAGSSGRGRVASGASPLTLHCAAMPAGVRAVQLLREERRLLITLADGKRRRLALGESVIVR